MAKTFDPYTFASTTVSGLGDLLSQVDEQRMLNETGREDLANYIVGNTWGDIFNNSDRRQQGLNVISDSQVDYSRIQNNDNLINSWNSNDLQDYVNYSSPTTSVWGDVLGDAGKAAAIGSTIAPGVGTLVGAGIGALSGIVRGAAGDIINRKNTAAFNRAIARANQAQVDNFYNTAMNNQQRQQRQAMMNYFALGGNLEGLNGIEHFNVGSSHSENPNGGIQQGIAPDGQPNLVEEGEVKYKDYIYSKRIKPSKALLKKNNLPEKYAGLSYAEIADKLQQESEDRPNDPISIGTLDAWMERLQNAQEETRTTNSMRRAAKLIDGMSDEEKMGILAMMQGEEQPIMADGGEIRIKKSKKGTFTAAAKKHGKSVQEFASQVLAHPENYSPAMRKKANFARVSKSWNHSNGGELDGHLFPKGGGLGAFDYATQYILGQTPEQEWARIIDEDRLKRGSDITRMVNSNLYNAGLPIQYDVTINPDGTSSMTPMFMTNYSQVKYDGEEPRYNQVGPATKTPPSKGKEGGNDSGAGFDEADLRYAPAVGSFLGMLQSALQPRDYTLANQLRGIASQYNPVSAPSIGGYRRYTPYDVNLGDAENLALQASALRSSRGQNRATQAAINAALIDKFQETSAKRTLAAQEANEQRRAAIDAYNLGIDKTNASLQQAYDQLNSSIRDKRLGLLSTAAQAQDASDTAWSNSLSTTSQNFFNQLGRVGEDQWAYEQFMKLFPYLKS